MSIHIGYERMDPAKDGPLPVGMSRLGQFPDVPEGHPRVETGFILQINLRDIQGMDTEGLLPKTGVLSIYRDAIEYYPDESVLRRPSLSPEDKERVLYGSPEDFLCKLVFGPDVEERAELFVKKPSYIFTEGMDYLEIDGEICNEVTASQYECEEAARGYTYTSGSPMRKSWIWWKRPKTGCAFSRSIRLAGSTDSSIMTTIHSISGSAGRS